MSLVIVSHRVKDYNAWRPYFDADQSRRSQFGIKDLYVTRDANDPNDVNLIFETQDVSKAQKMFEDEGLRKVMEQAGVISEPTVKILNKV